MKIITRVLSLALCVTTSMVFVACDDYYTQEYGSDVVDDPGAEAEVPPYNGGGIGKACTDDEPCRNGLTCEGAKCVAKGIKQANEKCLLTDECADAESVPPHGLHCGWAGFCVPSCVGCPYCGDGKCNGDETSSCSDCQSGESGADCAAGIDTSNPTAAVAALLACDADAGTEGSDCSTSSGCHRGLFCDMQGLSGYCADPAPLAGGGDVGDNCDDTYGCLAGLRCTSEPDEDGNFECVPGSILLNPELFSGNDCSGANSLEAEMAFGVRMAVPGSDNDTDYFSFPHPSNIRQYSDGTVDLTGFPRPGDGLIGFDPIGATLDALDGEVTGWSLLQAAFFRFSAPIDPKSVTANETVHLVNLDDGTTHDVVVQVDELRNKFACANRIFVQPLLSKPLTKNTTYAAIVTTGVTSMPALEGGVGEAATQLDDMAMLLDGSLQPTDGGPMKAAWDVFQPLRDCLTDSACLNNDDELKLTAADIAGATVFTTGDPTAVIDEIRDLVDTPAIADDIGIVWSTTCDGEDEGAIPSRCATPTLSGGAPLGDSDSRACPGKNNTYTEYHTQVSIPVIQQGTRPYVEMDTEMEGDLNYVDGTLTRYSQENICMAVSVPKGDPPAGGWPVLLYGHGTGGTHRQGIALLGDELGREAKDAAEELYKKRFVVVAWDQPMHHLRRFPIGKEATADGQSLAVIDATAESYKLAGDYDLEYPKEPGPLFYNFQNPRAARANYLQSVADTFSLVKLLASGSLEVDGTTVNLDPARIAYHGHSQGGGNGPMVAPFEPDLDLMVISGAGGGTVDGILGKKLPYDSSIGCRIMLQEIDVSRSHPGIQVLQHYFDAIDPGIYGPLLDNPPSGRGLNYLHVVGVNDSFTPPVSMASYARSANMDLLVPPGGTKDWFDSVTEEELTYFHLGTDEQEVPGPISNNRTVEGELYTRVSIQHPPCNTDADCPGAITSATPFDGHFVVYQNVDALQEVLGFLYTWAKNDEAEVVPQGSNL